MCIDRQQRFLAMANEYKEVVARVCNVYASSTTPFADLYQEVMINLWQGMESWRGDAKLSTWIYRVAINTCITWHRRNRRHEMGVSLDSVFEIADETDEMQASMAELYDLIGRLDPFDKALITLWLDEKSYEDISQVMGITKTNVATRLSRIRHKLANMNDKEQ